LLRLGLLPAFYLEVFAVLQSLYWHLL